MKWNVWNVGRKWMNENTYRFAINSRQEAELGVDDGISACRTIYSRSEEKAGSIWERWVRWLAISLLRVWDFDSPDWISSFIITSWPLTTALRHEELDLPWSTTNWKTVTLGITSLALLFYSSCWIVHTSSAIETISTVTSSSFQYSVKPRHIQTQDMNLYE